MSSRRERDFDQMWKKLRFNLKDGKHVSATLVVEGQLAVRTMRSHGSGKLEGQVPEFIRQQMFLSKDEFNRALDCPLGYDEYLRILESKGKIRRAAQPDAKTAEAGQPYKRD